MNLAAQEQRFDVVAVSSVMYPKLADRYWVLASGNSVGRGWGPVLVSKHYTSIDELRGKRIAVGGMPTTGSALTQMYLPDAEYVSLEYDKIARAIAADEFDAGVMIHEELLFYPEQELRCVLDLGCAWLEDTGLPLPVGLNLVLKQVGRPLARAVSSACRRSLLWGLEHPDEAFAFASRFGRGRARKHVEMFSNEDTTRLPADVRQAMSVLFERVAQMGIGPALNGFEVIED